MGRKRKNTFSKALGHLKSTKITEAAPVNSTTGVYSITPGTLTRVEPGPDVPDYSTIDWDVDGGDGKDTSGLFDSNGDSKFIAPPGDNSYILGPMSAMYYTWSYPWTMVGYIRESDRRMVNLGRIDGKLGDWDGSSGNGGSGTGTFYSYGQLTTEQALWFRDTNKKDNAGNDPDNANYRAFYPGPPSNTPDAFGRYYCTITGTPIAEKTSSKTVAPIDLQASDILSAIMDRLKQGKQLSNAEKEFLKKNNKENVDNFFDKLKDWKGLDGKGKTIGEKINAIKDFVKSVGDFGTGVADGLDTMWDVKNIIKIAERNGNIGSDGEIKPGTIGSIDKPMLNQVSDTTAAQILDGVDIGAVNMGVQIQNNVSAAPGVIGGDGTMGAKGIHNNLPNMGWNEKDYPLPYVREDGAVVIPDTYKFGPQGFRPARYSPTGQDEDKAHWMVGAVGDIANFFGGDGQKAANSMGTMLDQALPWLPGIPGGEDPTVHFETVIPADQVNRIRGKSNNNQVRLLGSQSNKNQSSSNKNQQLRLPGSQSNNNQSSNYGRGNDTKVANLTQLERDLIGGGSVPYMSPGRAQQLLSDPEIQKLDDPLIIQQLQRLMMVKKGGSKNGKNQEIFTTVAHYKPQGKLISESRKNSIIKNLKQPIVLPETKQKSYKVNPGRRLKTNFQGMDKLVNDITTQEPFKRKADVWSKDWQGYNSRLSQDKKNMVLELIGDGKHYFDYMLSDSKIKNAEEMEKFWGLHPEMHSYFYNGKKHKATRKEEVKGDMIVFMEDENGVKSTILQSELNLILEAEHEKEMLSEYNKLNEPTPFFKDPLMKKVAKRLKNEIEYEGKPAVKGYPDEPPAKQVDGWHPEYGKKYKYDKLDPVSAVMMKRAPTGDPEIDANVEKAAKKPKIKVKEEKSNWRDEIG